MRLGKININLEMTVFFWIINMMLLHPVISYLLLPET